MEAPLCALLDEHAFWRLFANSCDDDEALRRDVARLLGAYFVGWPLLCAARPQLALPSLFVWQQTADGDKDEDYRVLTSRRRVAAALPPMATPTLATRLLWRFASPLEALLFVDHFNDFRAALALRHLVDLNCGLATSFRSFLSQPTSVFRLDLLPQFCCRFFGVTLVAQLCDETLDWPPSTLRAFVARAAEALVHVGVLFDTQLVARSCASLVATIARTAARLPSCVPARIAVSRRRLSTIIAQIFCNFSFHGRPFMRGRRAMR